MRRYETRTVEQHYQIGWICDGCGTDIRDYGIEVTISVNAGEEGGREDRYDYCDDCLLERADALVAAGSRAPLVTGEDEPEDPEDDA
jgi:hypothetical protein